jgi:DNA topoisomerase I
VKIPKDLVPEELTYEQCKELADKTPEKKGRGGKTTVAAKKPAAKKKAPAKKKAAPKKKK